MTVCGKSLLKGTAADRLADADLSKSWSSTRSQRLPQLRAQGRKPRNHRHQRAFKRNEVGKSRCDGVEKADATEYGLSPPRAVLAQRASGRLWIEAKRAGAKASVTKSRPEATAEVRGPESRHAETSPARSGAHPQPQLRALRALPRTAGVVRTRAHAAVAEHREARPRCPAAW